MPTIPPYVDPNLIPNSQSPLTNYGAGQRPTTGGPRQSSNQLTDILGMGDPLFGMLFGGGSTHFQPYQDANGQWVFQNPNERNPVPISTVPGAGLTPGRAGRNLADQTQSLQNILPYLTEALNKAGVSSALGGLDASRATSGGYAELQANLFNTYGPVLNQIGNEIQRQNALASASRENEVLQGPGKDLVKNAYDLSQIYDKPYYDTRAQSSSRLKDLMDSIDLSGGLSETERREIQQGQARQGIQRGTLNAPSNTDVVSNAMQFGQAGHARQQEAKSNLSDAIAKAAAFLPTAKSGVDVFQTATGRSSSTNPGQSLFTGTKDANNSNSYGLAGNLLSAGTNISTTGMNIDANKKDWLDKFNQIASGIGSIAGVAGAAAGCWIAREVYGARNTDWIRFRHWLFVYAPKWFRNLYLENGERFAKWIHNKPFIKSIIRKWMNSKIN